MTLALSIAQLVTDWRHNHKILEEIGCYEFATANSEGQYWRGVSVSFHAVNYRMDYCLIYKCTARILRTHFRSVHLPKTHVVINDDGDGGVLQDGDDDKAVLVRMT